MRYVLKRSSFLGVLASALLGAVVSTSTPAQAQPGPSRVGGRVIVRGDGNLAMVVRGQDTSVHFAQRRSAAGSGWGSWDAWHWLGGALLSDPVLLMNWDSRLLIVGLGTDGRLWEKREISPGSKTFGAWNQIPPIDNWGGQSPAFVGEPALVRLSDGRTALFAVAANGTSWMSTQTTPGGSFGAFVAFGNPNPVLAPRSPSVSLMANGGLLVFAADKNNAVWFRRQPTAGGSWDGWAGLGGLVTWQNDALTTGVNANGRVSLIMNNAGATLSWRTQTSLNGADFTSWANLPPGPHGRSTPTVARNADGRLSAFFFANFERTPAPIYWTTQSSPSATTWTPHAWLGSDMRSDPVAVTDSSGKIHLFALNSGNYMHEIVQTAANSTTWTGWADGFLGGPFLSL